VEANLKAGLTEGGLTIGVGLMHRSNQIYINKLLGTNSEYSYTQESLEKATQLLVNKDDTEIAAALGIRPSESRNQFTSMLLVLGFMKHFQCEKIYMPNITGTIGVFFTNTLKID